MAANETLKKIGELLKASQLHEDDRIELLGVITSMPEDDMAELAKIFQSKPGWIYKMMDNLTLKRMAFEQGDENLLTMILEEEDKQLAEAESESQ